MVKMTNAQVLEMLNNANEENKMLKTEKGLLLKSVQDTLLDTLKLTNTEYTQGYEDALRDVIMAIKLGDK